MNSQKSHGIAELKKYWRDVLMQLIGWGTTIWLIVIGWLLLNPDKFSFFAETRAPACVMAVMVPFCGIIWSTLLVTIYRRWLIEGVDETVVPQWFVVLYSTGWTLVVSVIALVICST